MEKNKAELHCLSINCPERFSLCCGAYSTAKVETQGKEVFFVCSKCEKGFVGGKCTAAERAEASMTAAQKLERDLTFEFIKLNKRYPEQEEIQEMMIKETRKMCRNECEKDILTHRKMVVSDILKWVKEKTFDTRHDDIQGIIIKYLEKYE